MIKNLFLIIMAILPTMAFSQEYEYIPFPDSGAVWSEVFHPPFDGTNPAPIFERFALSGEDTLISDTIYKKLYIFYDTAFNIKNATYIGGIREDINKRVYFKGDSVIHDFKPMIEFQEHNEFLLYDFSLNKGDTLWQGNFMTGIEWLIVQKIDTVLINNSFRKRFYFEPFGRVKWIEGIGSIKGLLFTSGDLPTNGLNNDLICFRQDNEILYLNEKYDDCMPLITGISTKKNDVARTLIYPNPVTNNELKFEFTENIAGLIIFDCSNKLVGNYMVGLQSSFYLSTEKYQPGIYFYIATNKKGIGHTGKFVVQ